MELKEEKIEFRQLNKVLHFIVLVLSLLALKEILPKFNYGWSNNDLLTMMVSLVGVLSFWLVFKRVRLGDYLMLLWCVVQFISIQFSALYFDLSQGFSIPFGIESIMELYGNPQDVLSLKFNFSALILLIAIVVKIKHSGYYDEIFVQPIKEDLILPFSAYIEKSYLTGSDKRILVLTKEEHGKKYAFIANKSDKLKFENGKKGYMLCLISSEKLKSESLKSYAFKQFGEVYINKLE